MASVENLHLQIKDLLILNNGDVRITDHPHLVKDAAALQIDMRQLSHLINTIYNTINWKVYELIDQQLLDVVNNHGIVTEKEANAIITHVQEELLSDNALSYIVGKLQKLGLKPRDSVQVDWTSFKNSWMTDDAWKKANETVVIWLGEKASTLEKLGEISFRKIEETKYAIKNTHALPPLITLLTKNSASHEEYAKIIQEETDLEKRYLRILYRLNPLLPFRFNGKEYQNIKALLDEACLSQQDFWNIVSVYKNGYLHIWVEETSPNHKDKLTENKDANGFLTFLYKIDPGYPFFVQSVKYDSPALLAADARLTAARWFDISGALDNGGIHTWLNSLGKHEWLQQLAERKLLAERSGLYNDVERWKAAVQSLIDTAHEEPETPHIECNTQAIVFAELEAGKPVMQRINLQLLNEGFVKAGVHIENAAPGISVDKTNILLHSHEGITNTEITLTINPVHLVKDEVYKMKIVIQSIYQQIQIPLMVKAVFPKKAFVTQLVKYAVMVAAFFGLLRVLLQQILHTPGDASSLTYLSFNLSENPLPFNPLAVLFPLALLVALTYYSVRVIKKLEKI
jgi:hypothetical protein